MRTLIVALGVLVFALGGIELIAQSTDPVVGTWELNVAKSKYSVRGPLQRVRHEPTQ
jgi:hypothetical protein